MLVPKQIAGRASGPSAQGNNHLKESTRTHIDIVSKKGQKASVSIYSISDFRGRGNLPETPEGGHKTQPNTNSLNFVVHRVYISSINFWIDEIPLLYTRRDSPKLKIHLIIHGLGLSAGHLIKPKNCWTRFIKGSYVFTSVSTPKKRGIFFKYHLKGEWDNWVLRALYSSQQPSWEFYQQGQLHIEGQRCFQSCSSLSRWEDGFLRGRWWGERRDQHSISYPRACCWHDSPQSHCPCVLADRSHCLHKCFHRRPDDK